MLFLILEIAKCFIYGLPKTHLKYTEFTIKWRQNLYCVLKNIA